jgi:hypothetical protein
VRASQTAPKSRGARHAVGAQAVLQDDPDARTAGEGHVAHLGMVGECRDDLPVGLGSAMKLRSATLSQPAHAAGQFGRRTCPMPAIRQQPPGGGQCHIQPQPARGGEGWPT